MRGRPRRPHLSRGVPGEALEGGLPGSRGGALVYGGSTPSLPHTTSTGLGLAGV